MCVQFFVDAGCSNHNPIISSTFKLSIHHSSKSPSSSSKSHAAPIMWFDLFAAPGTLAFNDGGRQPDVTFLDSPKKANSLLTRSMVLPALEEISGVISLLWVMSRPIK